jgi:methyl-accepting chemotaxis protein
VGTMLDPKGAAIASISKGQAYYGVVDILGKKYEAGYEPIKNGAGEVIGVYYIGFKLE